MILKVSKPENVMKEKENIDIANNELSIIGSILKDESNFAQIEEKKLITKDNLTSSINIYKGIEDKSLNENIKDFEEIVEKMEKKEKEEKEEKEKKEEEKQPEKKEQTSRFKVDTAILNNIKKSI